VIRKTNRAEYPMHGISVTLQSVLESFRRANCGHPKWLTANRIRMAGRGMVCEASASGV
jgi:hypothetical protein